MMPSAAVEATAGMSSAIETTVMGTSGIVMMV